MRIAKKYFLFQGVDRKKAELKRVRIAKKIHSSLLCRASWSTAVRSPWPGRSLIFVWNVTVIKYNFFTPSEGLQVDCFLCCQQWRVSFFRVSNPLQTCLFSICPGKLKVFFRNEHFFVDIIWKVYILINMPRHLMTNERGMIALERLRKIKPFVQASLSITKKRCGNPRSTRKRPVSGPL